MLTIESAREWYSAKDPVHGFDHMVRVYRMAERLALAEGADLEIVRAAALLHDANPPGSDDLRENHHHASALFAQQILEAEGWATERAQAVQHCIRAHRFRDNHETPQTLEAKVLFDADKLDAIGAIGVARAIGYALSAGQPFYSPPSERFQENGQLGPTESHSAYHEYFYKLRWLKDRLFTASGRVLAEQRHSFMQLFFEQLVTELHGER